MGELKESSPIRLWAGKNEKTNSDNIGVIIYRERLPKEASFKQIRKEMIYQIEELIKKSPYDYWVSPKAKSVKEDCYNND